MSNGEDERLRHELEACRRRVAELERIEKALLHNQERFQRIFEHSNDAVFVIDVGHDRILDANPQACRMLGYSRTEMQSLPISRIHPKEMPRLLALADEVFEKGVGWTDELTCLTQSGEILPAEITASVIESEGKPKMLTLVRSVRERKLAEEALRASEQRFRSLYQNTPVMMHSIDAQGRLANVNDTWLRVMGYEREEVIGRMSTDFLTEESCRFATEVAIPKFLKEGESRDIEYQLVKKTGEVIDVLLSAVAETDREGEFRHSLAFLVDVTERKRAEAAVRESEERLGSILATAMDAIVTVQGSDFRVQLFNEAAEKVFGCPASQVIGQPFDRFMSPALQSLLADQAEPDGPAHPPML